MMDKWKSFFELIDTRRSIRRYEKREVEEEKILRILEAVRLAPSSSNSQPWHVIVVRDRGTIEEMSKAAPIGSRFIISWLSGAPVVFVLSVSKRLSHDIGGMFGHDNLRLDAGIAGEHLVLAAHSLGLGTCWIGWFDESKVRNLVGLPGSRKVVALIPCGYPAEKPVAHPRKPLKEIYDVERFGAKKHLK